MIDSEIMDGDLSGTSVTGLNRASERYNGTASAATHTSGATVYFIIDRGVTQASFPTKVDEFPPLGVATSTLSFPNLISAIPQGFRHMEIIGTGKFDGAVTDANAFMRFNADAGANYIWGLEQNNNATVTGATTAGDTSVHFANITGASGPGAYAGSFRIWIPNYSGTTFNKTFESVHHDQYGATTSQKVGVWSGNWSSTAAVTQVQLIAGSGNWLAGTQVSMYLYP